MASFVQAITGFNGSGGNTNLFTSNFGAACTAGNTLIVGVCMDSATASITTISDSATTHNAYTRLGSFASGFGTIFLYMANNITANAGAVYQVQVTEGVALDGQIFAQEWSGISTIGMDGSITNSGTSAATTSSNTLTLADSNDLIFSIIMLQSQTNTYSAGSGYTNLSTVASSFTSGAMESRSATGPGQYSASFGMTTSGTSYIQYTAGIRTTQSKPGNIGTSLAVGDGMSISGVAN